MRRILSLLIKLCWVAKCVRLLAWLRIASLAFLHVLQCWCMIKGKKNCSIVLLEVKYCKLESILKLILIVKPLSTHHEIHGPAVHFSRLIKLHVINNQHVQYILTISNRNDPSCNKPELSFKSACARQSCFTLSFSSSLSFSGQELTLIAYGICLWNDLHRLLYLF